MATGIEVAGLVLGSLPVVVAGLKFYAEGIATSRRLRRYRQEFEDLRIALDAETARFENNLRWILQGIINEQDIFMSKAINQVLKDPDTEEKLKARLGPSYTGYIGTVNQMEAATGEFLKRLKLDASGKPPFDDPNALKRQYKKLEFGLCKSQYDDLLARLDKGNQMLRDLTFQIQTLDSFQKTSSSTRSSLPDFKLIHEGAIKIHNALKTSWKCFCSTNHRVHLRLEPRLRAKQQSLNGAKVQANIDQSALGYSYVVFRHNNPSTKSTGKSKVPTWTWEEADIAPVHEEDEESSMAPIPRRSKGVRFSEQAVEGSSGPPAIATPRKTRDVQDLCTAISNLQNPRRDVCLLLGATDPSKQKRGVLMYPRKEPSTDRDTWSTLSLADILDDQKFKRYNRLKLAVTLASSVLQLHETPWLQKSWDRSHILFIKCRENTVYQNPFVVPCNGGFDKQAPSGTSNSLLARIIRNKTLFALGVTLIELWYGQTLQQLRDPEDGPDDTDDTQETSLTSWNTADRLAVELEHEAGTKYSHAVRRCIRCDFNQSSSSLQDVAFQKAVYDGVVVELKETLEFLYAF